MSAMESMVARYFDGDLSESEARALIEAAERDPEVERVLRAYERVLATARALPALRAPARFTERVMQAVTQEARRGRLVVFPAVFRAQWAGAAAAAALAIVAFAGGLWMGRGLFPEPGGGQETRVVTGGGDGAPGAVQETRVVTGGAGHEAVLPAGTAIAMGPAAGAGVRYVRLVYAPREESVENVAVAGSFNGWDPASTPLRRQDGVWSTILVLPSGSYEYMFVENGKRWVTDPLAARTRDDGFGTTNAVLDVEL